MKNALKEILPELGKLERWFFTQKSKYISFNNPTFKKRIKTKPEAMELEKIIKILKKLESVITWSHIKSPLVKIYFCQFITDGF